MVEVPEEFHELLQSRGVAFVSTIGKRGELQNVFEKRALGPQTPVIQQVPAALGGPLRASRTHSHARCTSC